MEDVQKLTSNASDTFKSIADTLKKCKKDDCKLRDKEIDDTEGKKESDREDREKERQRERDK